MGNYRVKDLVKKISYAGFTYFHIKLQKAHDKPFEVGAT
jgi:hypothetical protein